MRRRWTERRLRWRGSKHIRTRDLIDVGDLATAGAELPGVGVVFAGLALLLFAVAAVVFVLPALILILDLLLIIAIVGLGLAARVVLGRPWTVEAARGTDHTYEWKVGGWRASGELVESVAQQIRTTGNPVGGTRVGRADDDPA